jgi:hypothetical protein
MLSPVGPRNDLGMSSSKITLRSDVRFLSPATCSFSYFRSRPSLNPFFERPCDVCRRSPLPLEGLYPCSSFPNFCRKATGTTEILRRHREASTLGVGHRQSWVQQVNYLPWRVVRMRGGDYLWRARCQVVQLALAGEGGRVLA